MSSQDQRTVDRGISLNRVGAGEPPGEPAPPPGILDRVPDEIRRQLPDEVVDQLLAGARTEEEIVGPGGLLAQLTQRLVERALEVELTDHVGYERHQEPPGGTGNTRNGRTPKTLSTEHGPVQINTPRDRDGSFEPKLVRKRQRRFEGFDERILALYSRGMSTRDIEAHLRELYGVSVGRDLISRVTDAVMDDARGWQSRPLEDVYPVVFLDALVLKVRDGGSVQRKACYLALGVGMDGSREVLGLWFQETEGAKFWMQVLAELRHRGVSDILICCVDGLAGFPEAIEAVFPRRWCRPASCTSSAPRCATSHAGNMTRSPKICGRSTPRSTPTTPSRPWMRLKPSGASSSRPSSRPGETPGSTSPRFWRSRPRSAG
jgi:putative transposase